MSSDSSEDSGYCLEEEAPKRRPSRPSKPKAHNRAPPKPSKPKFIPPNPVDIESANTDEEGSLVYIFASEQDQAEIAVFRKICMKYGLQAWDQMVAYLPWRNRAALRTALCRILMKQALSEYEGIRADPFRIQADNKERLSNNPDFIMKAGMYINQQWDRTPEEWERLRNQNSEEYNISDAEADQIDIPNIISLEYMKQLCDNRRQSLLLVRAALRNELARRKALREPGVLQPKVDLGVDELIINPSETLNLPAYETSLDVDHSPSNPLYFDVLNKD